MIHSVLLGAFLIAASPEIRTERVWLVIVASDPTPAGIAHKGKALGGAIAGGLNAFSIQTRDCGDKKNVFGWATEPSPCAEHAQEQLATVRATVKDAYVKRCDVRPQTLLALRFPVLDPSIANVPESAVNWGDEDRISSALPLPDGRTLVVVRYFANIPNDPLEGRRERVILAESPDRRKVLEDDCPGAGAAVVRGRSLALQCAREQAGDQLLHSVLIFDSERRKLAEVPHCRKPRWIGDWLVTCEEESVGPDGQLQLRTKRVEVAPATKPNGKAIKGQALPDTSK